MRKGQFIERQISDYICRAAAAYPVVTICGPRQSGKTTLARHLFPDYDYVSMESPDAIAAFELDPLAFLQQHNPLGLPWWFRGYPAFSMRFRILPSSSAISRELSMSRTRPACIS